MEDAAKMLATLLGAGFFALIGLMVLASLIKKFRFICEPNEILIFSGGKVKLADGSERGFRVITGGSSWRTPFLERVDRMDMTLISVPLSMTGAYSEGGIPLSLHAIANVKISSNPAFMGNAIERFLGRPREELLRVSKETLEGHLRGVLATMTPEEVNEDRLAFAENLTREAGPDLQKLGLQLDTLKIQSVTDDRQYLDSIGRARIAEIMKEAEVAESNAIRAAEESEAAANSRGTVAETNATTVVQMKDNEKRQLTAQLEAQARSEEVRAEQAAAQARAEAEKRLQELRSELEQLRLQADVTIPAETERQVRELLAEGAAAEISAKGDALAQAIAVINSAWKECGDDAMDMVVVQHIDEIFKKVSDAAAGAQAKQVSLLDPGNGDTIAAYVDAYPATMQVLLDRISDTFGVDVTNVLKGVDKNTNGRAHRNDDPAPATL